jgi:hypothetical protein
MPGIRQALEKQLNSPADLPIVRVGLFYKISAP